MHHPTEASFSAQGRQSAAKCGKQTPGSWKAALMAPEIQVGVHERWAATAAHLLFSYECVQFKGIRSGLVCATAQADYSQKKKKKENWNGWYFIQHVQRPDSRRRSGWDSAEKQGWGPKVSPWQRRLAAVLPFPHLLQARTDDIHL